MYDFLFLSLYRHVMKDGISKQNQCVWPPKNDTTQNDMPTILQNLSSKSQESEGGEGRKGRRKEKEDRKNTKRGNKCSI